MTVLEIIQLITDNTINKKETTELDNFVNSLCENELALNTLFMSIFDFFETTDTEIREKNPTLSNLEIELARLHYISWKLCFLDDFLYKKINS